MCIYTFLIVLLQVDDPLKPRYKGSIDCALKVLRQNGIQHGLYKGMGPTLLRAFPSYAAAFYMGDQEVGRWVITVVEMNVSKF